MTKIHEGSMIRDAGKKVTSEAILLKTILKRTGLHNHTLITRKAIIGLTDWCTEHLRLKKKKTKKNSSDVAAFFANNNSGHFSIFQMHCFLTRNINNLETQRPYKKTINLENLKLICEKRKYLAVSTLFVYYFFVKVDQNIWKTANKSSSIDTNQILFSN